MRRVWLVFKLIESFFGLACISVHTRGYLNIEYVHSHYLDSAVFAAFTLMPMFGALSICMKEDVDSFNEGTRNLIAAISFFIVSLNGMYHAEKDFYLTYLSIDTADIDSPYPFFKYSKSQSVAALSCGVCFLLHSVFAYEVANNNEIDTVSFDWFDEEDRRVDLYVGGKTIHEWLDQFEWFHSLADGKIPPTD